MQTPEQIASMVIEHTRDIAGLKQSIATMQKRVEENDKVITGIHKLSANMESLTMEVKRLADRLENGLREQGRRIGEAETAITKLVSVEAQVNVIISKLDEIEKEPANKWKNLMWLIITGVASAILAYVFANIF